MKKLVYLMALVGLITGAQWINAKHINNFTSTIEEREDYPHTWHGPFMAQTGRPAAFYVRKAQSWQKKGEPVMAASYAAQGLQSAAKKKRIAKLTAVLNATYQNAVAMNMEKAKNLESQIAKYEDHSSTLAAHHYANLFREIDFINKNLRKLDAGSFEVKMVDMQPQLNNAMGILLDYKTQSASLCEAFGDVALKKSQSKESHKIAHGHYNRGLAFDKNYPGLRDKTDKSMDVAVTRILIMPFKDVSGNHIKNLPEVITPHLIAEVGGFKSLTYVEIYDVAPSSKKIHLKLYGTITDISITRKKEQPLIQEVSQKLKEKIPGKAGEIVREYKGEITTFRKSSTCKIMAAYELVEAESGTIVNANDFSALYSNILTWSVCRGSQLAFNKSQKENCAKHEPKYESDAELISSTMPNLVRNLGHNVREYALSIN